MKTRPMGAELFHAKNTHIYTRSDGQTDMPNIQVAFRNCANAPN